MSIILYPSQHYIMKKIELFNIIIWLHWHIYNFSRCNFWTAQWHASVVRFHRCFTVIPNKPWSPFWGLLFTAVSYIQLHTEIHNPQLASAVLKVGNNICGNPRQMAVCISSFISPAFNKCLMHKNEKDSVRHKKPIGMAYGSKTSTTVSCIWKTSSRGYITVKLKE